MARIRFRDVRHAYPPPKGQEPVYALKEINHDWEDGGAYALLGPLGVRQDNAAQPHLRPADAVSTASILFDGEDVTGLPASAQRKIAQVFPVPGGL